MEKNNIVSDEKKLREAMIKQNYRKDTPGVISGFNTPGVDLPAFNPPVPNRAWTAMRKGLDIDQLTEEEKRDLYIGHDGLI